MRVDWAGFCAPIGKAIRYRSSRTESRTVRVAYVRVGMLPERERLVTTSQIMGLSHMT